MSQKTIRNLIIFLLINLGLTVYIIANYFIQTKTVESSKSVVSQKNARSQANSTSISSLQNNEPKLSPVALAASASASAASSPVKTQTANSAVVAKVLPKVQVQEQDNKICVEMGPFNAEEKTAMDFILTKNKQTDLAKVQKMQSHQLFWNLGKNKSEAETLFAKQKEGAMASSKFVLTINKNNDWVVNITKVHGSEDMAKKLLKDLQDKAQKINAGGTWEYITLPEGYFYKFTDFKALKEVTVNSIDIMLKASKDPC